MAKSESKNPEKALEIAIGALERQYGKGTIMRLDDDPLPHPSYSTGALTLDLALGIGGFPKGRIVEIFGPESSGKSTLCLNAIASVQQAGGKALFIDAEHSVDPNYAKALNVNLNNMIFSQPDTAEEALEVLEKLLATGTIDIAIVDSVAALAPRAEVEGTMEDQHMGLKARLMSMSMRKIQSIANNTGALVIFTNQIRHKIGVYYGSNETTPGGRALPFHASIRIDLRAREKQKDSKTGEITGMKVVAKIVKNKLAPPFKEAEFYIKYGTGIDLVRSIFDVAVDAGIIERAGAWYSYDGDQIGQGAANAIETLTANIEMIEEITQRVYSKIPKVNSEETVDANEA